LNKISAMLTVSIIQTALHWENKAANLQMFDSKIAALPKTELVLLPEMFSTGFSMQPEKFAEPMDGPTVQWMQQTAMEKRIILCGSLMISEAGKYYNRLLWVLPNGQIGSYDKRHLFSFGNEHLHYTAGNKRLIASVKGWKINLQICYDLRFPVWSRQQMGEGAEYDLLVYVANWPQRRSHAWKSLLMARAIENQAYCIGLNRVGNDGKDIYHSGDSMIIDPLGETLYHKADVEDSFTITLDKEQLQQTRQQFAFLNDADQFQIL
jgi:omega-amidase